MFLFYVTFVVQVTRGCEKVEPLWFTWNKPIVCLYCKSRSVNCAQSFEVVEVYGGQE